MNTPDESKDQSQPADLAGNPMEVQQHRGRIYNPQAIADFIDFNVPVPLEEALAKVNNIYGLEGKELLDKRRLSEVLDFPETSHVCFKLLYQGDGDRKPNVLALTTLPGDDGKATELTIYPHPNYESDIEAGHYMTFTIGPAGILNATEEHELTESFYDQNLKTFNIKITPQKSNRLIELYTLKRGLITRAQIVELKQLISEIGSGEERFYSDMSFNTGISLRLKFLLEVCAHNIKIDWETFLLLEKTSKARREQSMKDATDRRIKDYPQVAASLPAHLKKLFGDFVPTVNTQDTIADKSKDGFELVLIRFNNQSIAGSPLESNSNSPDLRYEGLVGVYDEGGCGLFVEAYFARGDLLAKIKST